MNDLGGEQLVEKDAWVSEGAAMALQQRTDRAEQREQITSNVSKDSNILQGLLVKL